LQPHDPHPQESHPLTPDRIRHLQNIVTECRSLEAQLELQWFPRETRFRLERFFNRTLRTASAELSAATPDLPSQELHVHDADPRSEYECDVDCQL
jgi:predicted Zn-dependent protease|tara:strand:- start:298 stop:585 length:288 start_codon:yes stop_codon:yes gene_type:complete